MQVKTIERPSGVKVTISVTKNENVTEATFLVEYKNERHSSYRMADAKKSIEEIETRLTWQRVHEAIEKEVLDNVVAEFENFLNNN